MGAGGADPWGSHLCWWQCGCVGGWLTLHAQPSGVHQRPVYKASTDAASHGRIEAAEWSELCRGVVVSLVSVHATLVPLKIDLHVLLV